MVKQNTINPETENLIMSLNDEEEELLKNIFLAKNEVPLCFFEYNNYVFSHIKIENKKIEIIHMFQNTETYQIDYQIKTNEILSDPRSNKKLIIDISKAVNIKKYKN